LRDFADFWEATTAKRMKMCPFKRQNCS